MRPFDVRSLSKRASLRASTRTSTRPNTRAKYGRAVFVQVYGLTMRRARMPHYTRRILAQKPQGPHTMQAVCLFMFETERNV